MPALHPQNETGIDTSIGIVFVHGIDGHHRDTWTSVESGVCWIDWLSGEIENARIFSFEHSSSKTDIQNLFSLDEIAIHLARRIEDYPRIDTWIFIAHSLGGLIAKRAFLILGSKSPQNSHFVFFATPHLGSRFYFLSGFVRSFFHREHIVQTLIADEKHLANLNAGFLASAPKRQVRTLSYHENRRMFGLEIVSRRSTIIGGPYSETIPILGTHTSICKFNSPADTVYSDVIRFVREIISKRRTFKVHPYTLPAALTWNVR